MTQKRHLEPPLQTESEKAMNPAKKRARLKCVIFLTENPEVAKWFRISPKKKADSSAKPKDAKSLRRIVHIFITGLCGCHRDGQFPSIKGHSVGCEVRENRSDLKRLLDLADSFMEGKP